MTPGRRPRPYPHSRACIVPVCYPTMDCMMSVHTERRPWSCPGWKNVSCRSAYRSRGTTGIFCFGSLGSSCRVASSTRRSGVTAVRVGFQVSHRGSAQWAARPLLLMHTVNLLNFPLQFLRQDAFILLVERKDRVKPGVPALPVVDDIGGSRTCAARRVEDSLERLNCAPERLGWKICQDARPPNLNWFSAMVGTNPGDELTTIGF